MATIVISVVLLAIATVTVIAFAAVWFFYRCKGSVSEHFFEPDNIRYSDQPSPRDLLVMAANTQTAAFPSVLPPDRECRFELRNL